MIILSQCLWRCYAADKRSQFVATWKIHIQESHAHNLSSTFSRVARRASASLVKRRCVYKHSSDDVVTLSTNQTGVDNHLTNTAGEERKTSDDSLVFFSGSKTNLGKIFVNYWVIYSFFETMIHYVQCC